ncbi:hypothetical protein ACFX2I_018442 [Malus domestica]
MAVIFLLIFVSFSSSNFASALLPTTGPDFSCSADSPTSSQAYVTYISQPPSYKDLGSIADVFGVSHSSVSKANKQVSADGQLVPGQPLLIPINCGFTGNHYFANVTYRMNRGDNYFHVPATLLENLTNLCAVKDLNLGLNPTDVMPGSDIIFPLFCKCPSKAHSNAGVKFLATYVWQSIDDVFNRRSRLSRVDPCVTIATISASSSSSLSQTKLIQRSSDPHCYQELISCFTDCTFSSTGGLYL